MKKRILRTSLVLIGILMLSIIYINSSYFIKNQKWKYSNGTHIGDWFNEGNLKIKDGIAYGSSGKAKIIFC